MDYISLSYLIAIISATLIIAYAYIKRKIDTSAAAASGILGILVLISLGTNWEWFSLIIGFFIFGNLITKYKYREKRKRRVAQKVRTARNVFGNGGAAMIYAVFYGLSQNPIFLIAFLGAMATASADTFATEIGQAHEKHPRMITTLKKAEVGSNGAISISGLVAAIMGSGIIALIPLFFGEKPLVFIIGTISGFIGCNIDSLLGATIEGKRLDKHIINFLATLFGGVVAMLVYTLFLCYFI